MYKFALGPSGVQKEKIEPEHIFVLDEGAKIIERYNWEKALHIKGNLPKNKTLDKNGHPAHCAAHIH